MKSLELPPILAPKDTDLPEFQGDSGQWNFSLASQGVSLFARGLVERLPSGDAGSLEDRVSKFFERQGTQGSSHLVGALPFDRQADDFIFAPAAISVRPPARQAQNGVTSRSFQVISEPSRTSYATAVAKALTLIAASGKQDTPITKVVLARTLKLVSDGAIDPHDLLARLEVLARHRADPQTVRYMTPLGAAPDGAPRWLVGATPELLASRSGDEVISHPLAGSARRSTDPTEDEAAAEKLMASAKDRREHALVVEAILDHLSPLCRELHAPSVPAMVSTGTMWHLGTRIVGRLKSADQISSAGLAALLHPTPAVAGTPREPATALIRQLEPVERGFYAGAVGWTEASGDGAWYVSLRCAEISGRTARLYAGAGIVEGSVPEAEADETSGKLLAMLNAFGIDETGHLSATSV